MIVLSEIEAQTQHQVGADDSVDGLVFDFSIAVEEDVIDGVGLQAQSHVLAQLILYAGLQQDTQAEFGIISIIVEA